MKKLFLILLVLVSATELNAQHQHDGKNEMKAQKIKGEHSLYHLEGEWSNHRDETITLEDYAGSAIIVVMFYGNCTEVCPILIRDAWRLYKQVNTEQRPSVNVLAVTFDTQNDTPERLRQYAEYEHLDIPNWHFLTSNDTKVYTLAMMLGMQYSKKSEGHFAHSNLVTILDKEGRIAKRVEGLNQPMEDGAETIESIMQNQK